MEINSKVELDNQISQHSHVLALFTASRCPFCQKFAKIFSTYLADCSGVDLVVRVNMDDFNSSLWDEYNINAVPTLMFFEAGILKSRLDAGSGVGLTENQFIDWLKNLYLR